jgi:hypothetical protein
MFVNLRYANFEDLLTIYYDGTLAHKAAETLGDFVRRKQHLQLSALLRNHQIRPVYSRREISLRAATDQLLGCCSIMEIASLMSFVPELRQTEFGIQMLPILEDTHVRRYCEEFYPIKLPQLFRHRLAGTNRVGEEADSAGSVGSIMAFLELDRRFMANLDDSYLLLMLDSFSIKSYRFADVVTAIGKPDEFISALLLAPQKRDVLSQTLNEFSLFMRFCFDLLQLLTLTKSLLLQSAIWNYYSYWFDIIGDELNEKLGEALSQFLQWKPARNDIKAAQEVQTYVAGAFAALETLTSRRFAEPVDNVLKNVSRSQSI